MPERSDSFNLRAVEQEAAEWLARRDRGLTPAEQDDYLQWLREDGRRAACIARHEDTLRRLKQLKHWQPAHSSEPNPDLFARSRRRFWRGLVMGAGLAAVVAASVLLWQRPRRGPDVAAAPRTFLRVNERQVLADGTLVELRDGSRIEVAFNATERRVRLTGGEAHFTVAKNEAKPFIVEAAKVAVRAVGTAFSVRLDAASVDVFVTEGKVQVEPPKPAGPPERPVTPPVVTARHRAVVSLADATPAPQVTPVTPQQLKDALAWQAPRFQFHETPLADAVAEFNRHNRQVLVIADAELQQVPIGGTFRVDNVEGFASLLELTLGIQSEQRSDGALVLKRAR